MFVLLGTALIQRFVRLLVAFGVFLIYTGFKIIRHRDDEGDGEKTTGLRFLRRIMPGTEQFDGQKFITVINGRRTATPLLAALVVIEVTDVIFAVDSVPAILAVSNDETMVVSPTQVGAEQPKVCAIGYEEASFFYAISDTGDAVTTYPPPEIGADTRCELPTLRKWVATAVSAHQQNRFTVHAEIGHELDIADRSGFPGEDGHIALDVVYRYPWPTYEPSNQ